MYNILKNALIILSVSVVVSACGDQAETQSPAQGQIDAYSKKLDDCKDGAENSKKTSEENPKEEKHVRNYGIEPDDIVYGNPEAPVVFVVYTAPTCPHCVSYYKRTFPEIQKKYIDTGKIAYVTREFVGSKQDLDASILARCKGDQDSYTKFMHVILEQQESWAYNKNYREILTNIGSIGGVSPEKYATCLKDKSIIATLMENRALIAKEPRFIGTPSFFINGKQYNGVYTLEDLSKAIDAELPDGS